MMKLPRGATGFGQPTNASPEPELKTLAAICHHAARRTHGTITAITPAGVTPNFHTAAITYPDRQITVLRHGQLPLLAFVEPRNPDDTTIEFIDDPELAAAIGEVSDLRILTRTELNEPLSHADLTDLDAHEHNQIAYWNPDTVGELLFNFWD